MSKTLENAENDNVSQLQTLKSQFCHFSQNRHIILTNLTFPVIPIVISFFLFINIIFFL